MNSFRTSLDVLRPVFEERIISRRADIVWSPRSCDLKPLDTGKPETIEVLKDNICEVIVKIQLHTIIFSSSFFKHFPKRRYLAVSIDDHNPSAVFVNGHV